MNASETPDSDPSITKVQRVAVRLKKWFGWVDVINSIVGLISAFWFLYLVFHSYGVLVAFAAFLVLAVCYKFGTALVFVTASSYLHFQFHAVGLWLPVVAYVTASISFVVMLFFARALRPDDS